MAFAFMKSGAVCGLVDALVGYDDGLKASEYDMRGVKVIAYSTVEGSEVMLGPLSLATGNLCQFDEEVNEYISKLPGAVPKIIDDGGEPLKVWEVMGEKYKEIWFSEGWEGWESDEWVFVNMSDEREWEPKKGE